VTDQASIAPEPPGAVAAASPPSHRRAGWDIAVSVVFLVFALITGVLDAFLQFVMLAFTDDCPPATCHIDQGTASVSIVWLVMAIVFVLGTVVTIILLVMARRAWWVALIVWVGEIAGAVIAYALYAAAVG
jgi:hypothetical protein